METLLTVILILLKIVVLLVPLLVGVPRVRNHSGPLAMIIGTFIRVSTLLMTVGLA